MTESQLQAMDRAGETGELPLRNAAPGSSGGGSALVAVDAKALRQLLVAVTGPGHHIRELQATRSLHALGHPNPIDTLIDSYNAAITASGAHA